MCAQITMSGLGALTRKWQYFLSGGEMYIAKTRTYINEGMLFRETEYTGEDVNTNWKPVLVEFDSVIFTVCANYGTPTGIIRGSVPENPEMYMANISRLLRGWTVCYGDFGYWLENNRMFHSVVVPGGNCAGHAIRDLNVPLIRSILKYGDVVPF